MGNVRAVLRPVCVVAAVAFLFACGGRKEAEGVPTGEVVRGTFYIDLYEEGEVEAINSVNIMPPLLSWRYGNNLKIMNIVKDGQEVEAGDTLIVFDPTEVNKAITDVEAQLEIARAEMVKMEAQHQSDLEELRADYEVTRLSHEISRIRFESAAYESEISKKEIQLNLDKAKISLERAAEQIENRIKIQKEEVKQKNLAIKQFETQLDEGRMALEKLHVVTRYPGIAIICENWSTSNKYQIGDQTWTGALLIQLPDMSSMKAVIKVNEVDISKVTKGLGVEIRPDAFSEQVFTGKVSSVANLAVNKEGSSKIKVFPVDIIVEGENKELLPGLTVSCRVIIDKLEDVLYVPLTAVTEGPDGSHVWLKTGGSYERKEVVTGARNADYIVIEEGLQEKDRIALVDPFAEKAAGGEADGGAEE